MRKITQPIYEMGSKIQEGLQHKVFYPMAVFKNIVLIIAMILIAWYGIK